MPPQRRPLALQSPFSMSNVHQDRHYHPTRRIEGIMTGIYAEMSRMQHEHKEAMLMLQNHNTMLRALANENASVEEQNKSLLEHIKILEQENCALELKNNKLMSKLAKKRLQLSDPSDEKQPHSSTSIRSD